ncbi:MAG: hypothetical protein AAF732_02795 [Pseudomonadota bacterium]
MPHELIKQVVLVLFSGIFVWVVLLFACQFMTFRYVHPGRHGDYKRAIRKWKFDDAENLVRPDGLIWLSRVRGLLRSGMVILSAAAFIAVGLIVIGPSDAPVPPTATSPPG